ncbi:AzlC family ABC transporter permease [Bacillus fonticola]|uniref:AzlC family ABC transporter permease n=1 Tax=Bacillus fonticola TaxID=2728853 RepID=UPI001474DA03|nr:AzlC family ABC transporter permease [Bacillus fonticola]
MELSVERQQPHSTPFISGVRDGVSIAIGYMPIALAFGLLAKSTGLTLWEAIAMSVWVFAGASQYMALNLIAMGTSAVEIVMTTFVVNIRHFLMSASLQEKAENESKGKQALYAFGITDETFSVAAMKKGTLTSGYLFGLIVMAYGSWVMNSGIGYVGGELLPAIVQEGMGIALYAMFVGLLVPSMKGSGKIVSLGLFAAAINSGLVAFGLSAGWAILLATLVSAVLVEWVVVLREKGGYEHGA